MIAALRMHWRMMKVALAGRLAYRGDFFLSVLVLLVFELVAPLVTWLIYRTGASFPGWSLHEALLIQGIFLLAKGVASPLFFGIVWNVLLRVREGTFDLLLIKPRSVLYLAIATGFNAEDLGKLAGGIALTAAALAGLPSPGLWQWTRFMLLFLVALAVLFSFALLLAGSVFKWVGNSRVYDIFDAVTSFGLYPTTIFAKGLRDFITLVIPVAMIGFFPAATLLGRSAPGTLAAVVLSFVFLGLSVAFWRMMQRNYTSAGG